MSTCVCLHLTYLCQHTLSLLLILPVTLCVTPPAMHELSVIPAYTVRVCVCARIHRGMWIFSEPSQVVGSDASILFIQPIKVCHFIPMETCLGL